MLPVRLAGALFRGCVEPTPAQCLGARQFVVRVRRTVWLQFPLLLSDRVPVLFGDRTQVRGLLLLPTKWCVSPCVYGWLDQVHYLRGRSREQEQVRPVVRSVLACVVRWSRVQQSPGQVCAVVVRPCV